MFDDETTHEDYFMVECMLGNVASVDLCIQLLKIDVTNKLILCVGEWNCTNCVDIVDRLLREPTVGPSAVAFRLACRNKRVDVVDRLLQDGRTDPSDYNNVEIRWASMDGYVAVVDRLLQDSRTDPSDNNNDAIHRASKAGHVAVVDRLLQDSRTDPSTENNDAICWASKNGHTDVVDLLMNHQTNRVNPAVFGNYPFRAARQFGHTAVMNRLLQDDRVLKYVIKKELVC